MQTPTISASALHERMTLDPETVIVDVRSAFEVRNGRIPRALHLPLDQLSAVVRSILPGRDARIVLYCAHGIRSAQALHLMRRLGYERLHHLESGFAEWEALGLPVEIPSSSCEVVSGSGRYSRQILLEEVGAAGQELLSRARVLLIGVGGLGSPAALYLASAGIGTLGLIDPDVVDISNLHRQILHDTSEVGAKKVHSASKRIAHANPDVAVEPYCERLTRDNVERILGRDWDVIIDGADNFETRYTVNDVATRLGVAVCHGSIDRFEGRVTTFLPGGPCYRCLFPRTPQPRLIGSCAERGVLGVLPGVIGTLQATEAMKLILGIGEPLMGRLLTYDALTLEFRQIRYEKEPNCRGCERDNGRSEACG